MRFHPLAFIAFSVSASIAAQHTPQNANRVPLWQMGPFTRPVAAPVISPNKSSLFDDPIRHSRVHWEALHAFNPAAVVRNGKIFVLYRAEDDTGKMAIGEHTSRLGLASSTDGVTFTRMPQPVFYPALDAQQAREWPGGVEDPRIVESEDGTYVLTYTQWNRVTYSIGIATSKDLIRWTKYGPAFFGSAGGKYDHLQYKSGGIVTHLVNDRPVAVRVKGRYWMYWGEGSIRLATSPDLIHWTPVEDASGSPIEVLTRRLGHFDSGFPEVGPPPILTSKLESSSSITARTTPPRVTPTPWPQRLRSWRSALRRRRPSQNLIARTGAPVLKTRTALREDRPIRRRHHLRGRLGSLP